jgi:hypothetical protein
MLVPERPMRWAEGFDSMTVDQARFVRRLRVELGHTWRGVAEECAAEWDGDWGFMQPAGREICERAAEVLGEDGQKAPWN